MATKKKTGKTTATKRGKGKTPPPPAAIAVTQEGAPAPGDISGGRVVDETNARERWAKKAQEAAGKQIAAPAKARPAAKPKKKREGLSGLDAAAQVLAKAKEPLSAKAIAERAIAAGWKTNGATPHATLYSAMIREISTKGKASRFAKSGKGRFTAAGKEA